jgi:ribosome biogenesis GTPase
LKDIIKEGAIGPKCLAQINHGTGAMEGLIIKGIGGFYYVSTEGGVVECKAKGIFRLRNVTPMVGDKVVIEVERDSNVISEILPRSSELERPMVANVTQAFVVSAMRNPDINEELLMKFIVMLEKSNITPVLVFNKVDLSYQGQMEELTDLFMGTGYRMLFIGAKEGRDFDVILKELTGNITVFCGPSGAGKSTMLNRILGKEHMETGVVSVRLKRGKHTTRHSELVNVNDGFVVDTPGFSSIELSMETEELKDYFPEFHEHEGNCRFTGCSHNKEPGCSVKDAVGKTISEKRYNYYLRFLNELMEVNKKKWSR